MRVRVYMCMREGERETERRCMGLKLLLKKAHHQREAPRGRIITVTVTYQGYQRHLLGLLF